MEICVSTKFTLVLLLVFQTGRSSAKFAITATGPFTQPEVKHRGTQKDISGYVAQHSPHKLFQNSQTLQLSE